MRNNQCGNYSSQILINYHSHETKWKPLSQTVSDVKVFLTSACIRLKLKYFSTKSLLARSLRTLVELMWLSFVLSPVCILWINLGLKVLPCFCQKITGQSLGAAAAVTRPCSPCPISEVLTLPVWSLLPSSLPLGNHLLSMFPDNPLLAILVSLLTKEMSYFITFKLLSLFIFSKADTWLLKIKIAICYKHIFYICEQMQVLLLNG